MFDFSVINVAFVMKLSLCCHSFCSINKSKLHVLMQDMYHVTMIEMLHCNGHIAIYNFDYIPS